MVHHHKLLVRDSEPSVVVFQLTRPLTHITAASMSQGILSLAKQGNPRAIAALINHSTQPQGITVQVARQENGLHILFESNRPPNQQDAVTLIRNSMRILKVEPIEMIKVYGRQRGEKTVSWSEVLHLTELPSQPDAENGSAEGVTAHLPADLTTDATRDHSPSFATTAVEDSDPQGAIATRSSQNAEPVTSSSSEPEKVLPTEAIEPQFEQPEADVQAFLRRPEAVVLIIFVSMIMLWQLYLDLLDGAESTSLSGRELANRLGTNQSTISRRKEREDFGEWTQALDPDGIAWIYQNQSFVPKLHAD